MIYNQVGFSYPFESVVQMSMDSMERAFYDMKFDLLFQSKTANEFQLFFSKIMSARYPGDFVATRPWGQLGDQKCDGYILSTGTFYQVYAPEELDYKSTTEKMKTDFAGALDKWGKKIQTWVFVHNAKVGVPPHVLQQLTTFQAEHKEIKFAHLGKDELKAALFETAEQYVRDVLGAVPTYSDVNNLSMESIKRTLLGVSMTSAPLPGEVKPVSQKKLEANGLSSATKQLFEAGMIKSNLIELFFKQWHDPSLEEKTASEMNRIYKAAVNDCVSPDDVFQRIFTTICGTDYGNPTAMISALTIMAYFFQTCDIFEQPREGDAI
ncbi:ABC-three component system protein [Oscillibacter ruminantium]|uniref:ABC-three component system protein n=1 Tax=Oscillibacter ruminantium TaxID=1263547 RepID=UPI0002F02C97|nr:ABC-three component system protein [Oscillibacter ruminantium]